MSWSVREIDVQVVIKNLAFGIGSLCIIIAGFSIAWIQYFLCFGTESMYAKQCKDSFAGEWHIEQKECVIQELGFSYYLVEP